MIKLKPPQHECFVLTDKFINLYKSVILKQYSRYNTDHSLFSTKLSRISEGKEKDDPKTIPLKIFAKDIGNCAYVSFPSSPVSFHCLCQHKNSYYNISSTTITYGSHKHLHISVMFTQKCFHQAKTLAVSNTDSTTEVIRMALLQFSISVSNRRPVFRIQWLMIARY